MGWLHKNLKNAKARADHSQPPQGGICLRVAPAETGSWLSGMKRPGEWSQPAFYTIGSVTFGLQIGGESAEVIMVVRTQKALGCPHSRRNSSWAAIPPLPQVLWERGAKSAVKTDIVSFAKSKGLFAGLNLEGSMLKVERRFEQGLLWPGASALWISSWRNTVSNPGARRAEGNESEEGREIGLGYRFRLEIGQARVQRVEALQISRLNRWTRAVALRAPNPLR
ncbi:MAG: lipid-binding SYLF domain-containing protein [Desulfosudis oleivorans]|nr:lipid-binding SYLF domain-containing protein [Desulfosudis oleivorans]